MVLLAFLQQDAFDEIDSSTPLERQQFMLNTVIDICDHKFNFGNFEECATFFKGLINICRQMNYSEYKSEQFDKYYSQLRKELENE